MQRWVKRRNTGSPLWHWLAPPDRAGNMFNTVCGLRFDDPDEVLERAYAEDVSTAQRCPDCQAVYARVIRQAIGRDPRL